MCCAFIPLGIIVRVGLLVHDIYLLFIVRVLFFVIFFVSCVCGVGRVV